jgi:hypothetical protein
LRGELPGIATNLLSDRLRLLTAEGLVEQFEVPAPVARTMYRLSDAGWQYIPPVIAALARFGFVRLGIEPGGEISPLTGFLTAFVAGFNSHSARMVDEDYRAVIDGRDFDFGVQQGQLRGPRQGPSVELHARASDLVETRRQRGGALPASRVELRGESAATAQFLSVFGLRLAE